MTTTTTKSRRGPTVLMSDARDSQPRNAQRVPLNRATGTRLISVENILQYTSDIPSQQRRGPPSQRPHALRTPSGRHPVDPKLTGRLVPQHHIPTRSSKLSEKLVLLPETAVSDELEVIEEDGTPPRDEELAAGAIQGVLRNKSYAERLPKESRTAKLARVTAYCTAQAYKMKSTAEFIKTQHQAKTKLYDDCLYTAYHLPLLPGHDGYRVRSSPALKTPGGRTLLDEEIERNELAEYHDEYYEEQERYSIRDNEGEASSQSQETLPPNEDPQHSPRKQRVEDGVHARVSPNALSVGEMFVFSYGVVVLWNFTERQEKDILADLTFSTSSTGISLVTRPLDEADFETEEFHFEYNPDIPRPRMYNDMITLKSGDHMIKLAMSHALAQSTKLSLFEEKMASTMLEARYIPKRLALTGKLGMGRGEVTRMIGQLFTSRVEVNLSSNMLDTPGFFWDAEPTLHPLYTAVREYLEIKVRVDALNERCRVFLDLGEMLSDSIADKKMTRITWIIIILIVISICVTCLEVIVRFAILSRSGKNEPAALMTQGIPGPGLLVARSAIWMAKHAKRGLVG